jgi:hypothetical protein
MSVITGYGSINTCIGWQNVKRFDMQKLMIIWSIAFGLVLNIITTVLS